MSFCPSLPLPWWSFFPNEFFSMFLLLAPRMPMCETLISVITFLMFRDYKEPHWESFTTNRKCVGNLPRNGWLTNIIPKPIPFITIHDLVKWNLLNGFNGRLFGQNHCWLKNIQKTHLIFAKTTYWWSTHMFGKVICRFKIRM